MDIIYSKCNIFPPSWYTGVDLLSWFPRFNRVYCPQHQDIEVLRMAKNCVPEPCAQNDAVEGNQGAIHTEANGTGLWAPDPVLSPYNGPKYRVWPSDLWSSDDHQNLLYDESSQIHSNPVQ